MQTVENKRQFGLRRLLLAVAAIALILAFAVPRFQTKWINQSALHFVLNEIDHLAVRDAGRKVLGRLGDIEGVAILDPGKCPESIAKTNPRKVTVANGELLLDYGCERGDVYLVVVAEGGEINGNELADGISYMRTE